MSHQTRRAPAPAPTSLECPLASLGRNSSAVLDALAMGGHHQPPYHHPLSSSPLNPQVYQMSRKSPDLSIDADDIIYTSSVSQQGDVVDGLAIDDLDDIEEDATAAAAAAAAASQHASGLPEMYHLSRSSSRSSSLDQVVQAPVPVQRKAATFELRGRHGFGAAGVGGPSAVAASSTSSVGRNLGRGGALPQRNYLAIESLLQYGRHERTPSAYLLNGGPSTEESSDAGGGGVSANGPPRLSRHQGGRCSVPTVSSGGGGGPYFLEKKMDALYLGGGGIRGLPLGSEATHFQNERYYLEDGLLQDSHLLHRRPSSPSETSGSDRYLLNRTSSPVNVFNASSHLDSYSNSSSNNNGCSSNNNNNSSSGGSSSNNNSTSGGVGVGGNNMAGLDGRFHHTKVTSLSDGLCNLGRFSPSLDQGYATLVSPSPTGHHPNTITTHTIVHASHGPLPPPPAAATMTVVERRRHPDAGPPPWNKKGPCRSGPVFDRLPDEAVLKLFAWLDSCELCTVARVCRRFENLAWRPVLWKVITLRGEHLSGDKTLKMIFRQLCGQSRNGSCPDVERVMLADGCRISDKGLQLLTRRCPELTHLQLQTCVNISNQALTDVLTRCTNLQHLDVTGCAQVTNISVHPGLEPPRRLLLQYLDLTDCTAIDDVGLKIVVKNCPQLVYLYLRRCIQITDAGLKFVPSFCIALKELSVSDCMNITDFGLYELAKLGAALRYLSVAKCDRVSDAGLKVIARRCYKLRYLNARGCEAVSDDSITVLARSCPRLRALDIGKCDVSDAGLRALAESCPNLKKLSLRNCDMITDRGVQCIAYYCRGLQQLNIQDCQISVEGYRAVKKYCKRCIIEHTNPGFC